MAKAKAKQKSPFEGLWHIASLSGWDDYFNEEVQAFIELEANGTGHFQFGYVQGYLDWRPGTPDGQPAVEWTWEGTDGADMTEMTGRGWAKLEDDDLHGRTFERCPSRSRRVRRRPGLCTGACWIGGGCSERRPHHAQGNQDR
jgi:hypothetical protein